MRPPWHIHRIVASTISNSTDTWLSRHNGDAALRDIFTSCANLILNDCANAGRLVPAQWQCCADFISFFYDKQRIVHSRGLLQPGLLNLLPKSWLWSTQNIFANQWKCPGKIMATNSKIEKIIFPQSSVRGQICESRRHLREPDGVKNGQKMTLVRFPNSTQEGRGTWLGRL